MPLSLPGSWCEDSVLTPGTALFLDLSEPRSNLRKITLFGDETLHISLDSLLETTTLIVSGAISAATRALRMLALKEKVVKSMAMIAAVILVVCHPVNGQTPESDSSPDVLARTVECRAIASSAERLACFDAAVMELDRARQAKEFVIVSGAEVRQTRRSLFGLSLPQIKLFERGGEQDKQELLEITGTIASVRDGPKGPVFSLTDGAIWEQTDNVDMGDLRAGQIVVIRRAALGSYLAKIGTRRSGRVKRIK